MSESEHFIPGQPFWWQWFTILSLDAPIVAVVWQGLFAQITGAHLAWHHYALLGASTWLAYAIDRWIEGLRLSTQQVQTQRHYFYHRWSWPVFVIWIIVLVATTTLTLTQLSLHELIYGFALLAATLTYLFSHQVIHRHIPWRAPKELCVGILFAIGSAFFVFIQKQTTWTAILPPLLFFSALCTSNCLLISSWEETIDRIQGQNSLIIQAPKTRALSRWLPWCIATCSSAVATLALPSARIAFYCAAASAILMGLVDIAEPRYGRQWARAMVDLALMTPAATLLIRIIQ